MPLVWAVSLSLHKEINIIITIDTGDCNKIFTPRVECELPPSVLPNCFITAFAESDSRHVAEYRAVYL